MSEAPVIVFIEHNFAMFWTFIITMANLGLSLGIFYYLYTLKSKKGPISDKPETPTIDLRKQEKVQ